MDDDVPLDRLCHNCGAEYGDHRARTLACPSRKGFTFLAPNPRGRGARPRVEVRRSGSQHRFGGGEGIAKALATTRAINRASLRAAIAELAPELWLIREKLQA